MSRYCAKACKLALMLALPLSFACAHAQSVTIHGSCGSYGSVSWSAPTTEPAQVQLWEYAYEGSGLSEEIGSGYSGDTGVELSDGTYYEFVLRAGVTSSDPSGEIIAEETMNCEDEYLKTAAFTSLGRMGDWLVFNSLTALQPRGQSNSGNENLARSWACPTLTSFDPLPIAVEEQACFSAHEPRAILAR